MKRLARRVFLVATFTLALCVACLWMRSRAFNDMLAWPWRDRQLMISEFPGGLLFHSNRADTPPEPLNFKSLQYGAPAGFGGGRWSARHYDWRAFGFSMKHEQFLHVMGDWGGKYLKAIKTNDPQYANDPSLCDYRRVGVPFWFILSILLIPTLLAARRALWVRPRQRRLANAGRCPHCGYDLRESIDRCPECGAAIVIVRVVSGVTPATPPTSGGTA